MAVADTLEVKVKASIYIDDATADLCLKVVQMYLDQNADKMIVYENKSDGGVILRYEPR